MSQLTIFRIVLALNLVRYADAACQYFPGQEGNGNTCEGEDVGKTCVVTTMQTWNDFDATVAELAASEDPSAIYNVFFPNMP